MKHFAIFVMSSMLFVQAGIPAEESYKDEFTFGFYHADNGLFTTDVFGFSNTIYSDGITLDGSVPYGLAPVSQKASSFGFGIDFAKFGLPIDDKEFMLSFGGTAYGDGPQGFIFDFGYGQFDFFDTTELFIRAGVVANNFPTVFAFTFAHYSMDDAGIQYTSFNLTPSVMSYSADSNAAFRVDLPISISDDFGNSFGLNPAVTFYATERFGVDLGVNVTFPEGFDTEVDLVAGFSFDDASMGMSIRYTQSLTPDTDLSSISASMSVKF